MTHARLQMPPRGWSRLCMGAPLPETLKRSTFLLVVSQEESPLFQGVNFSESYVSFRESIPISLAFYFVKQDPNGGCWLGDPKLILRGCHCWVRKPMFPT